MGGARCGGLGPRELMLCAVSGLLFWIGGNGLAIVALTELPSSFVAMAMGTIPLWSVAMSGIVERKLPSGPLPILLGFLGLVLIFWPTLTAQSETFNVSFWAVAALVGAPVTWTLATMLQPGLQRQADPTMLSAIQLGFGALGAIVICIFQGAVAPDSPSTTTLLSILYMAVFGSALSFRSYVIATKKFSKPAVAAFAYVNPLVGLLLGWLVLGEWPEFISLVGTALVTLSVIVTLHATAREQRKPGLTTTGETYG